MRKNCQIHQKEFEFICLCHHNCQKRFCSLCLVNHRTEYQNIEYTTISQFFENLNQKFQVLYCNSFLDECSNSLIQNIQSIQLQYNILFNNIIQSIGILFESLKQYNSQTNNLLEKLKEMNIEKFTNEEFVILNQDKLCFQIQEINSQKKNLTNQVINNVKSLEEKMKYFHHDTIELVHNHNVIFDQQFKFTKKGRTIYSQLIGQEIFGFKHGEFVYKIFKKKQISTFKAGLFFLNTRQAFWREINFNLIMQGEYNQGIKVNDWEFIYDNLPTVKQSFDENGLKSGIWQDFSLNQSDQKWPIIIAKGEYLAGLRIGKWDIYKCVDRELVLKYIGGGFYDEQGQKIGFWKDINEKHVFEKYQIIWEGEYENGKRAGEWKISGSLHPHFFLDPDLTKFHLIGGGRYDHQGLKTGNWKDYPENGQLVDKNRVLSEYILLTKLIWQGEYISGLKVGEWKITGKKNFQFNGGGKYDETGQKIGLWREPVIDYLGRFKDFILEGEYKSGIKVGQQILQDYRSCIKGGGLNDSNGFKNGKWKEIHEFQIIKGKQLSEIDYLFWKGHYSNGVKVGRCKIFFQSSMKYNKFDFYMIGSYDQEGKKIGKWINKPKLDNETKKQVFWIGQYRKDLKIGKWKLIEKLQQFKSNLLIYKNKFKIIIFRITVQYDDNGVKKGQWIQFQNEDQQILEQEQYIQFFSEGQYLNGLKIGIWQSYYRKDFYSKQFEQICFGQYNSEGKKIGLWKDITKHRIRKYEYVPVISEGQYHEDVKIGQWKIYIGQKQINITNIFISFDEIGGGMYDNDGQKIGKWTDVEFKYQEYLNICFSGQYKQNLRIGQWKIFVITSKNKTQQIGGGLYNQKGQKIGWWIDIDENSYNKDGLYLLEGNYNEGIKVGEWKQLKKSSINDQFNITLLGGGTYEQKGRKEGQWEDITVQKDFYFIWEGQYNLGVKIGVWKLYYHQKEERKIENNKEQLISLQKDDQSELFKSKNKLIGQFEYNHKGMKVGEWKEINENYYNEQQKFIRTGYYEIGRKIGIWKMIYQDDESQITQDIGYYNEHGQKSGLWKDIDEKYFTKKNKIIFSGKYETGVKCGKWNILYKEQGQSSFEIVGGGFYNAKGQKIGVWRDIVNDSYNQKLKVVWEGQYNVGHRTGEWKILQSELVPGEFQQIGGGEYDDQGLKVGKWKDIDKYYYNNKIKIHWEGEYKAGVKVGNWQIIHKECNLLKEKTIKVKEFDQEGKKVNEKKI